MTGPSDAARTAEESHGAFDGRLDGLVTAASFRLPIRSGGGSGWADHAPFAFWLIGALRPRRFVELGTGSGYFYSVVCQAVQSLGLTTRCHAVDTWKDDGGSGFGGNAAYDDLVAFNDLHFSEFSRLVRSDADEARDAFEDGSIDLLHIDGRHSYDSVKHDYTHWLSKLSPDAVVMFHNIAVRESGFDAYRVWEELKPHHPHFEFLHGSGLGIIGRGTRFLPGVVFDQREMTPELAANVRSAYSRLGAALTASHGAAEEAHPTSAPAMAGEENRHDPRLSERYDELERRNTTLTAELAESGRQLVQLKSDLAQMSALINYRHALLGTQSHQIQQQSHQIQEMKARISVVEPVFEAAAMTSRYVKEHSPADLLTSEVSSSLVEELRLGAVVDEVALARRLERERTIGETNTERDSKSKSWLRRRS